jgi:O-antigen/teichoic acid export membrane protein
MTTERKFQQALKWAYTMNWGEKGFSALFAFVLAAILGPRDFGTVAMAMVYISFIQMFLDQGLLVALIQRKDLQREHLDAVFWMDLVASVLLVAVTVALSKWWAAINHLPELALVITALSIMVPIEGLSLVQRAVLQREMDFKSLSVRSNISVLIGGTVGLAMAFKGLGVWALVGQRISQDLSALALLWSLSHWRPRWQFSLKHLKDLLGFSTASFAAKLAVFGNLQSDAFLMGIFFGPVAVGLYRLADRLMNLVLDGATNSLQIVSLSQFSKVQDKPSELRQSALSCIRISATLTLPALAGLAVVSNPLMAAIGPQWAPTADVLKILCGLGMALVFLNFTGPLVTALSRPRFMAVLEWVRTATGIATLMVVSLLLRDATVRGQIVGVAVLRLVVGGMIFTPIFLFVLMRFCRIALKDLVAVVTPPACAAAATAAVLMALSLSGLLGGFKPIVLLTAETTVGGLVAGAVLLALDRQLRAFVFGLISKAPRQAGSKGASKMLYGPVVDPVEPQKEL